MIAYSLFFHNGRLFVHIGSRMATQQLFFVIEWIVALLWKLPQMSSCSAKDDHFFDNYKIYCCAAIHGRIWMNNVPNESKIIMLSCTKISVVIYIFQARVPFFPFFFLLTLHSASQIKRLHFEKVSPDKYFNIFSGKVHTYGWPGVSCFIWDQRIWRLCHAWVIRGHFNLWKGAKSSIDRNWCQ